MTHPRRARGPSILDVARLAGVSHQTVSRVLNGHPHVRETTRARVRGAIDKIGYRPNRAARALVTGRSQLLGVIAPRSTLFGPVSQVAAFEERAAEAGFAVSVARLRGLDAKSVAAAVERHLDQHVSGLVVIAPVRSAGQALDQLPSDIPVVTVDGDPKRPGAMVTVDQALGARLATQHLLDAGHRTVWHVSGPPEWFDASGRIDGWSAALRAAGVEPPPVIAADWSPADGYRAGQLLGRMPEVTAVFAASDSIAVGVLRALHERGRAVPQEVSVVGFDDIPEAAHLIPPLTTVRQDFDAVADECLSLLLAQLDGVAPADDHPGTDDHDPRTAHRGIEPVLVRRDSVAAPPAG